MTVATTPSSQASYSKLCTLMPGGVNSPIRSGKYVNHHPLVAAKAAGDLLWDVEGKCYFDYCMSWGPLIHGHANPLIVEAAAMRMALGTTFGVTTEVEGELAAAIQKEMPSIELIRFVSSGTEATMSAARLARGYTKKELIIKFTGHYHGHADFFLVQAGSGVIGLTPTSSSAGVPDEVVKHTVCLPFNNIEAFLQFVNDPSIKDRLAAVIVEPIAANMGVVPGTHAFIQMLREETTRLGAVLIFDEVVTGFRVGLGGAQHLYGIQPDLTCLGKIIGGGFPAAAFGGKKEIMECLAPLGTVYQAGTLSGNPVAMQAGVQTLHMLQEDGFYARLQQKADLITVPVRQKLHEKNEDACIQQVGSMFTLFFGKRAVNSMEEGSGLDTKRFAEFYKYMLEHGVYIPPCQHEAWFVSSAHTEEHLLKTRDIILAYFE